MQLQRQADIDLFYSFIDSIEKNYDSKGMPPHVADPGCSVLAVMTQTQYDELADSDIQDLLHHKNIVVTERPVRQLAFDEQGLEVLNTTMEAVTTIQGTMQYISEFLPLTRIYLKTSRLTNRRIITCAVCRVLCNKYWSVPRFIHPTRLRFSMLCHFRWGRLT